MATTAPLKGFFPPAFKHPDRLQFDMRQAPAGFTLPDFGPFQIEDARPLQAQATSAADFFDARGFVLLSHPTAVREWEVDAVTAEASEVVRIYYPEIEQL